MAENKTSYLSTVITVIVIAIIIAGYSILRSKGVIMKERYFYAYFNDVKGLQPSSAVQVNGVRIGKIADVNINEKKYIKITILLNQTVQLPTGTKAELSAAGLTGDKVINLLPGKGPGYIPDGSTIASGLDTNLMSVSVQITPYIETAHTVLDATNITLAGVNEMIRKGVFTSMSNTLISFDRQTSKYSKIAADFNKKSDELAVSIGKANKSAANLAAKNGEIKQTLKDAEQSTGELAAKPLKKNLEGLQASLESLQKTIKDASKENDKLLTDKKAYNDANTSLKQTKEDMEATMDNPPGFSILGKSKKKKS